MPRVLISTALTCFVAVTGLVGLAHTTAGRPLLSLVGRHLKNNSLCPLGYSRSERPRDREAARRAFSASHHGDAVARARPALGFSLDQTTEDQVLQWARAEEVKCTKPRMGYDLECADVPAGRLPTGDRGATIGTLWLSFGANGQLRSVVGVRRESSPEPISAAFGAIKSRVSSEAGPPSLEEDGSVELLASGALRQASAEYRFRNYYAIARATNMGDGYVLIEEYHSLEL